MDTLNVKDYLPIFIAETRDNLQQICDNLLVLEKNEDDKDAVNEIFRSIHTVKGMAATMGFEGISNLSHEAENLLDDVRHGTASSPGLINGFFAVVDELDCQLEALEQQGQPAPLGAQRIAEIMQIFSQQQLESAQHSTASHTVLYKLEITISSQCLLRPARAMVLGRQLGEIATLKDCEPPLEILPHLADLEQFHCLLITQQPDAVEELLQGETDVQSFKLEPQSVEQDQQLQPADQDQQPQSVEQDQQLQPVEQDQQPQPADQDQQPQSVEQDQQLQPVEQDKQSQSVEQQPSTKDTPQAGASTPQQVDANSKAPGPAAQPEPSASGTHQLTSKKAAKPPNEAQTNGVKHSHTIRVDTDKLDQLLNLVSELVINKTSIQQAAIPYPSLGDGVEHLHRLTGDLQNIVMNMRMIPLETVFNRFPRMVRDASKVLNKAVTLEVQGAETELDRTIIDDISDPLVHLLRNAVDHGIEPAEKRRQLGKPATGSIVLRAYQTGNQAHIEVEDDGAGLDYDKIRAKARAYRTWSDDDEPDLNDLIFSSGFTTNDEVTDISGRGVGLDVVKNSIESLGGAIDVTSNVGHGTTFRISLPLTLAIIQGLLVECGSEVYVIPLSHVQETEIIYLEDVQTIGQQQIVMLRGKVLPIIFLDQVLGVDHQSRPQEMSLVVLKHGEREIGLVIDELLNQQEIVIKNVNWGNQYFKNFLGSTILGDGSVVLILDINVFLSGIKIREVSNG